MLNAWFQNFSGVWTEMTLATSRPETWGSWTAGTFYDSRALIAPKSSAIWTEQPSGSCKKSDKTQTTTVPERFVIFVIRCPRRTLGTEERCNTTGYLSKRDLYYPDCCDYLECWYFERAKAGTLNVLIPSEEKATDGPYPFKMGTAIDNDNHNNRYQSNYNRTTSEEYKLKKSNFFM